ncbi:hypothetical protein SAMN02745116_00363 [Pilibacter termitis]|uniref:Type III secretion system protein PrgE n=1 Tax=Pilibacter termitis TaxID=263852 RepID=A0A1T4KSM2_9ENTE|nr:hypothetical protein [Pilibacter termitis]SJZ45373.1 hypothetical protein SAMN02745116_00363 [Pilibacter termitis]
MKYARPTRTKRDYQPFALGTHQATIKNVKLTETKKGVPMFSMLVAGGNNQSGFYNLVFETDYTEENLGFILASIEDNGVDIPDIEFGYTEETANFLKGKSVYVEVKEEIYKENIRNVIAAFLDQAEFEGDEDDLPYEEEDDWHEDV